MGEVSGSERVNQPGTIQGSEKQRDRMEIREWHSSSVQAELMTPPRFVNLSCCHFLMQRMRSKELYDI